MGLRMCGETKITSVHWKRFKTRVFCDLNDFCTANAHTSYQATTVEIILNWMAPYGICVPLTPKITQN